MDKPISFKYLCDLILTEELDKDTIEQKEDEFLERLSPQLQQYYIKAKEILSGDDKPSMTINRLYRETVPVEGDKRPIQLPQFKKLIDKAKVKIGTFSFDINNGEYSISNSAEANKEFGDETPVSIEDDEFDDRHPFDDNPGIQHAYDEYQKSNEMGDY